MTELLLDPEYRQTFLRVMGFLAASGCIFWAALIVIAFNYLDGWRLRWFRKEKLFLPRITWRKRRHLKLEQR